MLKLVTSTLSYMNINMPPILFSDLHVEATSVVPGVILPFVLWLYIKKYERRKEGLLRSGMNGYGK